MNSRFDHLHLLPDSDFPDLHTPHASRIEPRRPARSSRPSSPRPAQLSFTEPVNLPAESEIDQELSLENEIPLSELNDFALSCIEQLSISRTDDPVEKVITAAISEKLPSYVTLKAEFTSNRQTHRSHHQWTKQVYDAAQPLLKLEGAPLTEQQKLSELTLQCVEQNLQLQYRVDELRLRVDLLEHEVPKHLVQIGLEIGLPSALMRKMEKLVRTLMKQHA